MSILFGSDKDWDDISNDVVWTTTQNENELKYWMIKLIGPNRFLCYADLEAGDSNDLSLTSFDSFDDAQSAAHSYLNEFISARLPLPKTKIVGFDHEGREIVWI